MDRYVDRVEETARAAGQDWQTTVFQVGCYIVVCPRLQAPILYNWGLDEVSLVTRVTAVQRTMMMLGGCREGAPRRPQARSYHSTSTPCPSSPSRCGSW